MTALLIFFKSIKWTFQQWKMWALLYFINLGIALFAALPFFNLLDEKLSHSFEADKLIESFNFTVYSDFMAHYGDAVNVILGQSQILLLIFYFLSIFLTGGILEHCKHQNRNFRFGQFMSNCNRNFWKLLIFAITFLVLIIVFAAIFFKIFLITNADGDLAKLPSEKYFFIRFFWTCGFIIFISTLLMLWHDYAKIQFIQQRTSWFQSLKKSFLLVFKNFRKTGFLYLLNMLTFALLTFMYYQISHSFNASTSDLILLSLFLGQLFVLGRLGMKVLNLAGGNLMFEKLTKP